MEHMLAKRITAWCLKQNTISEAQAVAVTYGIELIFDTVLKLIGLMALGVFTGRFPEFLLAIASFSSLRCFAGGAHMRTSLGCFLSMVFVCAAACLGAEYIVAVPFLPLLLLSAGILLSIVLFAPFFTQNNPIGEPVQKKKRREAIILTVLLLAVIWAVPSEKIRLLMLIPVTIEALSILPCWHIGVNR